MLHGDEALEKLQHGMKIIIAKAVPLKILKP
jgi:hypothetical protein